ncbi:unnamed protein product [Acanthoscelides obtectus]|uniref:Uncharacterized protein n=1 Tax=Acanthoscelides obtectus TaxID=200917 RepID=A0A9P0P317_ACAOB|nr:unnamed protein product [Acanthoscelides obtectus]CAK1631509.1 hypothetical protein AOBTE_LOCUS6984 [Acanthoscelides obtectus]
MWIMLQSGYGSSWNTISSYSDQLNRLVQATVGHVSLVAALVFGCIGNQIFKSKPLGASVFLAGWVIAMFVICHAGQKIRDESLSVTDAIYFSDWHRGTVEQKKDIAFMMFRSQKAIFFDALPFGSLNYPLFMMQQTCEIAIR